MFSVRRIFTYNVVFCTATLIGYGSGYLNGVLAANDFAQRYGVTDTSGNYYLTSETRSLFSSIFAVGTIIGSGRKGGFLLAGFLYTVGIILQLIGTVSTAFIVGRVLLGMALGIISITTPTYLIESSSGSSRGRLMALYCQFLTCGNVLACGISMGTATIPESGSWRVTVGFQLFLALVVLSGGIFAPESPLILTKLTRHDAARQSMSVLRNQELDSLELDVAMQEIRETLSDQTKFGTKHLEECFQGPNLPRTLLGSTMGFMTIATGVTFWFSYGTTFFAAAGVRNSYLVSLILALVNAIFTAPSVFFIEKAGSRPCLLVDGVIMGVAQLATAVLHTVSPGSSASRNCLVAGSVISIAAYACTWGSFGEYGLSTWTIGFVVPYIVDPTSGDLGTNIAYLWTGTVAVSLVWAYLCVPELADLSKLEVNMLFEQRVPTTRSVRWQQQLRITTGIRPE
ncbi:hypothetical protein AUEXF2481DRAFT_48081 [Aureobasidium subglaciale EXF-2481]|uniref:Major facilitator superfamily (MFS) profile domain-containing protein n=1 Tax=Aureobasidium subglaciale (strain EXF-2481) TaxID=1043005 RepID=A0A074Y2X9_AURSE|nr:uncharacterized protein AUEXF2481DRAFT_48081 [Aureobasidium subglaciale EXF-2481]KEQ92070.1 hypothetical protein AUEXF2481DRAFT_48081 [Aureobasidium subglaciale EXF-2481]